MRVPRSRARPGPHPPAFAAGAPHRSPRSASTQEVMARLERSQPRRLLAGVPETPSRTETASAVPIGRSLSRLKDGGSETSGRTALAARHEGEPASGWPDAPTLFKALSELGPELLAPEARELLAWAAEKGLIRKDGCIYLPPELPSRFLHVLCGPLMFNFPCPTKELEGHLHASFLSHVAALKKMSDLGFALGAFDDATKKVIARGLSKWLSQSHLGSACDLSSASAFIHSAACDNGYGLVGALHLDQLRQGLERCSDGLAVSMLIATLRRKAPPDGWEDPFIRCTRDRLGVEYPPERLGLDEASRSAVVKAALAAFNELYADADGSVSFLGLEFPGPKFGCCRPETLARQLWWAAACARTSDAEEVTEARAALRSELHSMVDVLATKEERNHDDVLFEVLDRLAQRNIADSLFSSLATDLVGSVHARTHRMLTQDERFLSFVKEWNAEYASIPEHQDEIDLALEQIPDGAFSDFYVLNVQHLLGGLVPYVNGQIAKGAKPEDIYNVAVSYSDSAKAELRLRTKQTHVASVPRLADFLPKLETVMRHLIEESKRTGKSILVGDDGGNVALLLATVPDFQKESGRFVIAEQTKRGLRVAEEVTRDHPEFTRPTIVKVCSSSSKRASDGDVAKSAMPRLARIVEARADLLGADPEAPNIPQALNEVRQAAINGYGQLGAQVAQELASEIKRSDESIEEARARIAIWDPNPELRNKARADGFHVPRRHADLERGRDMVIGVVGSPSFRARTAARMDPYTLMISLSSKRAEAEKDLLEKLTSVQPEDMRKQPFRGFKILGNYRPRTVLGTETQLDKPNEHSLVLIYVSDDGVHHRPGPIVVNMFQPINFDHQVFALPPKAGGFIRALMLYGLYQASTSVRGLGPIDLDPSLDESALKDRQEIERREREATHLTPEVVS